MLLIDDVVPPPAVRSGRPRDSSLTERLLLSAGDLVIEHGIAITPDALARAARAGKASIYRRWPGGVSDLTVELVSNSRVVPPPTPGAVLAPQVCALLASWTCAPTRNELIVASALGFCGTDQPLGQVLRARIDGDLEAWWQSLDHSARDHPCGGSPVVLRLLRAMLVSRLHRGPLSQDMVALLERCLLLE